MIKTNLYFDKKEKAISALIATILLIVVAVVLISIIVSWGKNFSISSLDKTNSVLKENNQFIGLIIITNIIQNKAGNNFFIVNKHSSSLEIIGYYIISDTNYIYNNKIVYFDQNIVLEPNKTFNINVICLPDDKVDLYLIDSENKYHKLRFNRRSLNQFCVGENLILYHNYKDSNEDSVMDLSGFGNDGVSVNISKDDFGYSFNGTSNVAISNNISMNLGNNDFAIETYLKQGFKGHVFSKPKSTTQLGIGLFVDEHGYVSANFFGDDTLKSFQGIAVDEQYIYTSESAGCMTKRLKTNFSQVLTKCYTVSDLPLGNLLRAFRNMAIDGEYLYFSDYSRHRIIKVNKNNLEYVSHIGGTAAGSGDNQFSQPWSVFAYDGIIYVSDSINNRIKLHSADDLSFIASIRSIDFDSNFNSPRSVYINEKGIYIANHFSVTLLEHYPNLSFKKRITSPTTYYNLTESFSASSALAGYENNLFLAMGDGEIRQIFKMDDDLNGVILSQGGWGYDDNGYIRTNGHAIDENGILYIIDGGGGAGRIVLRNTSDLSLVDIFEGIFSNRDDIFMARKIAADENYLYVAATTNNKVLKINSSSQEIIAVTDYVNLFPLAITVDNQGNVYVLSGSYDKVIKFDSSLNFVSEVGSTGFGNYNYNFYFDCEIATDNTYIYFTDNLNHRIVKLRNSDLSFVSSLGGPDFGFGNNQFRSPNSIDYKDGELFIIDNGNSRVKVHSADTLEFIKSYSGGGTSICALEDYFLVGIRPNSLRKRSLTDFSIIFQTTLGIMDNYAFLFDRFADLTGIACTPDYVYTAGWYTGSIQKRRTSDFSFVYKIGDAYSAEVRSLSPIQGNTHLVLTREGNTFCVYLNGEKNNCKTYPVWPLNLTFIDNNPFLVGSMLSGTSANAQGSIDFLKIYKKTVSENEVKFLYSLFINN